jgi:thiol-disulfide isomerase/thioredoxin
MKSFTSLVLAFIVTITATAGEIKFVKNLTWSQIKAKAARENKMIFFDAYATWCGPCKYLEEDIYTDDKVAAFYNANYINVKFDMEDGEGVQLAKEFAIKAYPTLLFFSPQGKMLHKFVGALEAAPFINLGKDAQNPLKQYYPLKAKARTNSLSDADFGTWAALAQQLDDADKASIIATYLQSKTDVLVNAAIAKTVLNYTDRLNDKQLTYLYGNQPKIAQLMQWNEEKVSTVLFGILFREALSVYDDSKNNLDSFSCYIKKYDPKKENYAVKDLVLRIAVFIDKDTSKSTGLILSYLDDTKKPVSIEAIAGWLMDYADSFEKENFDQIAARLTSFKIRAIDKDKEYWLWLMQMFCYGKTGNELLAKTFAEKAYQHPPLPLEYKTVLKENFELSEATIAGAKN